MKIFLFFITLYFSLNSFEISHKGYWIGDVREGHAFDDTLAEAIADFFVEQQACSIVDFGCGLGRYVEKIRQRGLIAKGYDGNPDTPILSGGICEILDLSEPFQLPEIFDWVMSLEVGEHLPQQYEKTFIENLMRHARNGIILSWAIKNQGGTGHFNEQNNDYIKSVFENYGYKNDLEAENKLRNCSKNWFQHSLMVFRKPTSGLPKIVPGSN
jgi:2-polyprenyl-3-methyl-5-hydroxy-6-metoxy-1,4-benzoquinol methylase